MQISIQKHPGAVVVRPRITEKASFSAEKNQYVFEVTKDATKASIAKAVKDLYKVTPIAVNIVNTAGKNVVVRGKRGHTTGMKKAYVTLKKSDKIEIA